jgi:hypothetical protein
MHGWPTVTPEALPELLARLRSAGAELVTVDKLLLASDDVE